MKNFFLAVSCFFLLTRISLSNQITSDFNQQAPQFNQGQVNPQNPALPQDATNMYMDPYLQYYMQMQGMNQNQTFAPGQNIAQNFSHNMTQQQMPNQNNVQNLQNHNKKFLESSLKNESDKKPKEDDEGYNNPKFDKVAEPPAKEPTEKNNNSQDNQSLQKTQNNQESDQQPTQPSQQNNDPNNQTPQTNEIFNNQNQQFGNQYMNNPNQNFNNFQMQNSSNQLTNNNLQGENFQNNTQLNNPTTNSQTANMPQQNIFPVEATISNKTALVLQGDKDYYIVESPDPSGQGMTNLSRQKVFLLPKGDPHFIIRMSDANSLKNQFNKLNNITEQPQQPYTPVKPPYEIK